MFYFDDEYIFRKGYISVTFGKLAIAHSDLNANINISHFKSKILEIVDHLKSTSHKSPDVDSIFHFIIRTATSNITEEAVADISTDLIKQNIIINKKSINGRDSFRRNTIDVFSNAHETSDTDNTQQQSEKDHNDNNKFNSSLQQPALPFNETDIKSIYFSQQLAPKITTEITSLQQKIQPLNFLNSTNRLIFKFLSLLTIKMILLTFSY